MFRVYENIIFRIIVFLKTAGTNGNTHPGKPSTNSHSSINPRNSNANILVSKANSNSKSNIPASTPKEEQKQQKQHKPQKPQSNNNSNITQQNPYANLDEE